MHGEFSVQVPKKNPSIGYYLWSPQSVGIRRKRIRIEI